MSAYDPAMAKDSDAYLLAERLARSFGKTNAHRALDMALSQLSTVELAGLAARWDFWARPKQRAPIGGWRTWGFLTGRMFGKTRSCSEHINAEVFAGRAMLIGLAAQDEASAVDIQVLGPSGLIATSPPWFKAEWIASSLQVVWPNGARAYVRTPEVPGKIRGLEYHLSWLSEVQSWPASTRDEAWSNFQLATRLGYARIIWDATPKRRHKILLDLVAQSAADPVRHPIVRGASREAITHVGEGVIEELERKYGGTQKGREELGGEMLADSESALFKQEWIERCRALAPAKLLWRVLSVDPAVTSRRGSDTTGICDLGLGTDERVYVFGDESGRHDVGKWAEVLLDKYLKNEVDYIIAETNKGGQLVTQNLRAAAKDRGLVVEMIEKDKRQRRVPGKVFVKEVYARGAKEDRAEPVSTAYERGRVSHVRGADLASLEDTLTTWEPTPHADSPGDLDALVHGVIDLLGLSDNKPDPRGGFMGITELAQNLSKPATGGPMNIAMLIGGTGGGGRI